MKDFSDCFDSLHDGAEQSGHRIAPILKDISAALSETNEYIQSHSLALATLRSDSFEKSQSEILAEVQKVVNAHTDTYNSFKSLMNDIGADIAELIDDSAARLQNVICFQESEVPLVYSFARLAYPKIYSQIERLNKEKSQLESTLLSNKKMIRGISANVVDRVVSVIKDYDEHISNILDSTAEASSSIFKGYTSGISSSKDSLESLLNKGQSSAQSITDKIKRNDKISAEHLSNAQRVGITLKLLVTST